MRFDEPLSRLREDGLLRTPRTVTALPGGRCRIAEREVWNLTTNDYLDLAGDTRLVEAAVRAMTECGVGARASALVSGRTVWHERLETRIATFEGTEAALLFPTGYAANVGTLGAVVDDGVVFCDRLNHASLVDGCQTGRASLRVYRHDDLERLGRELKRADGPRTIVTDGVFSMDGDLAPLPDLCDLADRFDATVVVDEAHGTGVLGQRGRGACEHLGVEERGTIRIGTLSKAVGSLGGFVAGDRSLIEWLRNTARTQIYSTALPAAMCAAAIAAFDVIETEPERRETLLSRGRYLRTRLREYGVTVADGEGPIVPVIVGESDRVMAIGRALEDRGFLVGTIRPPTVPRGTSRLRISVTVAHAESVLDELAGHVAELTRPD